MASSSADFHEPLDLLAPGTADRHRALVSLQEEVEAADWYDQRIDAAGDAELRGILAHHRDEEKEHAAMLLEWLRRRDAAWAEHLATYLFTDAPVVEIEEAAESEEAPGTADAETEEADPGRTEPRHSGDLAHSGDLGIRSLREGATR